MSLQSLVQAPETNLIIQESLDQPIAEKNENVFTVLFFVSFLALFSLCTAFHFFTKKVSLDENRFANPFPRLRFKYDSINAFPKGFDGFFNDRFWLRKKLIIGRRLLNLSLFHVSASSDVLIGKKGYFFYASDASLKLIRHTGLFSPAELIGWKNLLERRDNWCTRHGMDYVFIIAPSKQSVYPELLPDGYNHFSGPTRTDQLIEFLHQTNSPVQILDLRAYLRTEGQHQTLPLYFYTDTHWNQLGAYYGYCSIIQFLRHKYPNIPKPLSLIEFPIRDYCFAKGDLAILQGLLGIIKEKTVAMSFCLRPVKATLTKYPSYYTNKLGLEYTHPFNVVMSDSNNLPKVALFRDSFAGPWPELFFRYHFSKIGCFWQHEFDPEVLSREKFQIVLQEQLETWLYEPIPAM